jgi:hypothetical protein
MICAGSIPWYGVLQRIRTSQITIENAQTSDFSVCGSCLKTSGAIHGVVPAALLMLVSFVVLVWVWIALLMPKSATCDQVRVQQQSQYYQIKYDPHKSNLDTYITTHVCGTHHDVAVLV